MNLMISHRGEMVTFGSQTFGPGVARGIAAMIEFKAATATRRIQLPISNRIVSINASEAVRAASILRRHAALAEVVRGPVGSGAIEDDQDAISRVDDIIGRFARILASGQEE